MNKYTCTETSLETLMAVWPKLSVKKQNKKQWQYLNLVVVPRHHEHFTSLLGSVAVLSLEVLEQSHKFTNL